MKRWIGVLVLYLSLLGAVNLPYFHAEYSQLIGRYENTWMWQGVVDGQGQEVAKLAYIVWTPQGWSRSCTDDGPDWTLDCYRNFNYDLSDCPTSGFITFEAWVDHSQDSRTFYHDISCDDPDPPA